MIAELLSPKFAVTNDSEFRGLVRMVGKARPRKVEYFGDHGIGKCGELIGQPLDREAAVQISNKQTKYCAMVSIAQIIDLTLLIAPCRG